MNFLMMYTRAHISFVRLHYTYARIIKLRILRGIKQIYGNFEGSALKRCIVFALLNCGTDEPSTDVP